MMDKEHFGRNATYTYTNMIEPLRHYGTVVVSRDPITPSALSGISVVVLKTPSLPFSAEEISCITEYVHEGGGLLVLGDHTNLIGMSTYLNEVLAPHGLAFNYDDLFFGQTGAFGAWERRLSDMNPLWSTMPARMRFETSASLNSPLWANNLLLTRSSVSEALDWSNPGFFGNLRYDLTDAFGCFSVASMVDSGKGRVIAFGDSTVFSNFSLFFEGRREALLAWVDMLSRARPYGRAPQVAMAALGLILCFVAIYKGTLGGYLFIVIGLSLYLSLVMTAGYYGWALQGFAPSEPLEEVVSVGPSQDSLIDWGTAMGEWQAAFSREYSTFYVCSQRIGFHPRWQDNLAYKPGASGLVLLDWQLLGDPMNIASLRKYLKSGVPLLLLLRQGNDVSPSQPAVLASLLGADDYVAEAKDQYLTAWSAGSSTVLIYSNMEALSRLSMGKVDAIPSVDQMKSYAAAFAVLEALRESVKR
ncbi:MAG TPA: hypothetical protein GXX30_08695 [Firmicutes bacterium]|nr:hypothetical protein [Candidatus Fermentithermobacillaceae bacterium]